MKKKDGKKIRLYFKKFPKWPLPVLLISVIILLLFGEIGLIGILAVVIGLVIYFSKTSDNEFDNIKAKSIKDLEQIAMNKLNLADNDLIRDTEKIIAPAIFNIRNAFFGLKRGKDKILRFTPVHVALIFFTEHKLCIYQCALDLTTGNPLNAATKKYFYIDIVCVERETKTIILDEKYITKAVLKKLPRLKKEIQNGKLQYNDSEKFKLTTSGGNSIEIQLPDNTIMNYGMRGELITSKADKAIAAVEAMVDNKKSLNTGFTG